MWQPYEYLIAHIPPGNMGWYWRRIVFSRRLLITDSGLAREAWWMDGMRWALGCAAGQLEQGKGGGLVYYGLEYVQYCDTEVWF